MVDGTRKVVGIDVNFHFPGGAWTSNDSANHRLSFLAVPGVRADKERIADDGLNHTAFEYECIDALVVSYLRIKGLGIEPDVCLNHGMILSLYYVDPDGNMVELQVDSYGDWAKSTPFMRHAPEFAANLIGVFFDPDRMAAEHRAGVPFDRIPADSYAGKYPRPKVRIGIWRRAKREGLAA